MCLSLHTTGPVRQDQFIVVRERAFALLLFRTPPPNKTFEPTTLPATLLTTNRVPGAPTLDRTDLNRDQSDRAQTHTTTKPPARLVVVTTKQNTRKGTLLTRVTTTCISGCTKQPTSRR